jgi:hypothetical protein
MLKRVCELKVLCSLCHSCDTREVLVHGTRPSATLRVEFHPWLLPCSQSHKIAPIRSYPLTIRHASRALIPVILRAPPLVVPALENKRKITLQSLEFCFYIVNTLTLSMLHPRYLVLVWPCIWDGRCNDRAPTSRIR